IPFGATVTCFRLLTMAMFSRMRRPWNGRALDRALCSAFRARHEPGQQWTSLRHVDTLATGKEEKQHVSVGGRPMRRASITVLFAAATLLSGRAFAQTTVLPHATLIDGTGGPAQRDVTIVMDNGRIRAIGPAVAVPSNAPVVDLTGKFVVPGIINAHGH